MISFLKGADQIEIIGTFVVDNYNPAPIPTPSSSNDDLQIVYVIVVIVIIAVAAGVGITLSKRKKITPVIPAHSASVQTAPDKTQFWVCPHCGGNTQMKDNRQYCPSCKIYLSN